MDLIAMILLLASGALLAVYHEERGHRVMAFGILFFTYAVSLFAYVFLL